MNYALGMHVVLSSFGYSVDKRGHLRVKQEKKKLTQCFIFKIYVSSPSGGKCHQNVKKVGEFLSQFCQRLYLLCNEIFTHL